MMAVEREGRGGARGGPGGDSGGVPGGGSGVGGREGAGGPENGVAREQGVQRMGEMLLQGWQMESAICRSPGCLLPLMRAPPPNETVVLCVNCDAQSRGGLAARRAPQQQQQRAAPVSTVENGDAHNVASPSAGVEQPLHDRQEDVQRAGAAASRLPRPSEILAERLLMGWTMLADECDAEDCAGAPLMRAPGELFAQCVVCGFVSSPPAALTRTTAQHGNGTTSTELPHPQVRQEHARPSHYTAQRSSNRSSQPAASTRSLDTSAIGGKLLQGWTMLAQQCAACNAPLMRAPHAQTGVCVVCGGINTDEPLNVAPQAPPSRENGAPVPQSGADTVQQNYESSLKLVLDRAERGAAKVAAMVQQCEPRFAACSDLISECETLVSGLSRALAILTSLHRFSVCTMSHGVTGTGSLCTSRELSCGPCRRRFASRQAQGALDDAVYLAFVDTQAEQIYAHLASSSLALCRSSSPYAESREGVMIAAAMDKVTATLRTIEQNVAKCRSNKD